MLLPVKVSVLLADLVTAPVPLIAPVNVRSSLRLKINAPLLLTLFVMLPVVLPAPTCKVPALMVVPPV